MKQHDTSGIIRRMETNPKFVESAFKDVMAELRRTNAYLELISDQLTLMTAYTANAEAIEQMSDPPTELSLLSEVNLRQTLTAVFQKISEDRKRVKALKG
jgi:hypothetical protein